MLSDNLDTDGIQGVRLVLESLKSIRSIQYFSPEETAELWMKDSRKQELIALLEENPFPGFFKIKLRKAKNLKSLHRSVTEFRKIAGVSSVEYGGKVTEEYIRKARRYIFAFLLVFIGSFLNFIDHAFVARI